MMRGIWVVALLCLVTVAAVGRNVEYAKPAQSEDWGKNVWRVSLAAMAGAQMVDVHSSWGKREMNSRLANGDGRFGAKGALIKLGITGGVIGVQYLALRRKPGGKAFRYLGFLNLGSAAAVGGVAARNYGVRAR